MDIKLITKMKNKHIQTILNLMNIDGRIFQRTENYEIINQTKQENL